MSSNFQIGDYVRINSIYESFIGKVGLIEKWDAIHFKVRFSDKSYDWHYFDKVDLIELTPLEKAMI